ncbi:glycosyltransferase family 2 protein [Streptomyces sp. MW-W600-10]|uniref:glycosyltransferase family 2 protein n=1 Tax=Streptomyces sp. MW-W600-10 TaxID=2829819 RepID=UPI001C43F1D6|nr:glycosyltransferase family 2 protein [Streptomyces sp. MW-W600-10]MBV7245824.1 glycosyltransferase family 2 protein [Streptomyces sp. MW-W600-10]
MPTPDLTVVIPSYQHADMLALTLGTLAEQTHKNFRVLVMDDDSTDNTSEVCASYASRLDLVLHVSRADPKSPSRARDEGARLAESPLVAFLDCGILVPSGYVAAHIAFHAAAPGCVGVGMCHGHTPEVDQGDDWSSALAVLSVDDALGPIEKDPSMADVRWEFPALRDLRMPWVWGWSGNISMEMSSYTAAGGFDTSRTYGYEDSDLAYRLHLRGNGFDFVEGGWGVHYPHPRRPADELEAANFAGWWKTYTTHRSLALEIERYSNRNEGPGDKEILHLERIEELYQYLNTLGDGCAALPPVPRAALPRDGEKSLLIGGKVGTVGFDGVTLVSETAAATPEYWSCAGVIIPLPDGALDVVVVSDVWRWLAHPAGGPQTGLLEMMIAEIYRVSNRAIFIDSPGDMPFPGRQPVSKRQLEQLCSAAGLAYTIAH